MYVASLRIFQYGVDGLFHRGVDGFHLALDGGNDVRFACRGLRAGEIEDAAPAVEVAQLKDAGGEDNIEHRGGFLVARRLGL